MLSTDRSKPRADQQRRAKPRTPSAAARQRAHDLPNPWDDRSAEALTRLYESEEAWLWKPASGERVRHPRPALGPDTADTDATTGIDRAWLEQHLSQLVERLQSALPQGRPEHSLDALNGRLESIEQRFSATLGRVAQRADLESLREIEAHVLELAAQLEQARARLDSISSIDDQIRALARKVEETGEQRVGGLERLLRDCIAEWREGEQRTAGALHNIEEAVGRLGETVDAMEAARPAPDLAVPTLTGSELERIAGVRHSRLDDDDDSTPPVPHIYHATLDAADYTPRPITEEAPPASDPAAAARTHTGLDDLLAWSSGARRQAGPRLTPGALRILALRAKLRQAANHGHKPAPLFLARAVIGRPSNHASRLTRLGVLLMAGAAFLVGSTYYLYQALVGTMPTSPAMVKPGGPGDIQSDLVHPAGRPPHGKGAS